MPRTLFAGDRLRRSAIPLLLMAAGACRADTSRASGLLVSYFAQDTAFTSAAPLRVSVGTGRETRSLRGMELTNRYPFLMSGTMPLDSGVTLPVTVAMLGARNDTLALARLTLGPVEPARTYTIGVTAGGRRPAAASACGVNVAVPMRRDPPALNMSDSLYVSIMGVRAGGGC